MNYPSKNLVTWVEWPGGGHSSPWHRHKNLSDILIFSLLTLPINRNTSVDVCGFTLAHRTLTYSIKIDQSSRILLTKKSSLYQSSLGTFCSDVKMARKYESESNEVSLSQFLSLFVPCEGYSLLNGGNDWWQEVHKGFGKSKVGEN